MSEKNVPNVRFKGFSESWEQRKLKSLLSFLKDGTHGTHKNVENGPYLLSAKNIKHGIVNVTPEDRKISEREFKQIHKNFNLNKGDVLLTIVGSIGEAAILKDPNNLTFQRSVAYLRPQKISSVYLYALVTSFYFQRELDRRKVVSAQPGIYLGDLEKIELSIAPNHEEQDLIGSIFEKLDQLIASNQRKLDQLKKIKKLLMQKIFDQEWRFKGFTDPWEQRKLESTADEFKSGFNIASEKINNSGKYPVFGGNGIRGYTDSFNHDGEYALIGRQGALSGNMNFSKGKAYFTEHAVAVKANQSNDTKFLFYLMLKMKLARWMTQSAQPGLSVNVIKNISVQLPTKEEQLKIRNLLSFVDQLVASNQQKLDQLKEMKKWFMQNMFV